MFLALIATYNEIMTFTPINWPWASANDGEKEFSVLTYNVMDFSDFDENTQAKMPTLCACRKLDPEAHLNSGRMALQKSKSTALTINIHTNGPDIAICA